MGFETVKTLKGEFVVILEETRDGGFLCVFPKGEEIILSPTEVDHDSFSEYSDDDMRVTLRQKAAIKAALGNYVEAA